MLRYIKLLWLLIVLPFYFNLNAQQKAVNAFYHASEIAIDSKGNLFVTGKNNKIIKITPDGSAFHFTGNVKGYSQNKDGKGAEAMFTQINGITIDDKDNLFIADYTTIRKVTPEGVVTTVYGSPDKRTVKDGNGNTVTFSRLGSIAVDDNGTLYVTDQIFDSLQKRTFNIIRKVSPSGNIHIIKNKNGSLFRSHTIEGLACDNAGNLYVSAMAWSSAIIKISADEHITTVAGVYDEYVKNRAYFKEEDARPISPVGIAINQHGEVFFSDRCLSRIFKVANNRVISVAGGGGKSANGANLMGGCGSGGNTDAKGKQSLLNGPRGIAFDKTGNLYIVDGGSSNNYVRKLSADGMVTTFCKQEYNPQTKQYEEVFQKENTTVAVNSNTNKQEAKPPQTEFDRQLDSLLNDPHLKKLIKNAQTSNVDSIKRAVAGMAKTASPDPEEKDTTTYALPGKNIKALAKIPKGVLSSAELQSYAANLYKKLAPAFHSAYGTPLVNTDAYDGNTISNASVFATEAARLDQAVLLSLKAIEKNPEDPAALNNAGAIFKKGGLEIAAVAVLEAANQKAPGNSTIQNNLGQAYLALGEKEKASQYLQRAITKSPYHPLANSSLALIDYTKGNKQSALKYVENSLRGAFTDKAWHLLYKLKRDESLMKYFRHRYKQPEYFNEDKYKLPMQCESVADIPAKRAEYDAYREMLRRTKEKFDATAKEEMKAATTSMMQKGRNGQLFQSPFMQLANAMMLDKKLQMEKGEWEKVSESQKNYREDIKRLQDDYRKMYNQINGCGDHIALANEYMKKMSVVTSYYQRTYLRIYKDFYHDMTYWSFFSSPDVHYRKGAFCTQASALLGVLLQVAETHFLDVTIDCASNENLKKEAEDIKIEGSCPVGEDGFEIPFGIGKFNINCEKWEVQFGEALVFNVGHKFTTGETSWAIGPGISFIGSGHESIKKVPEIKVGPLTGGVDAGIKAQVFLTFRNGELMDWGGLFEAELDLLGIAKEFKTGYTIGMNSGLQMVDGPLKNVIDRTLGPGGEAPQINKNIKIYKSQ